MRLAWLKATLVCGLLDILYAIAGTKLQGGHVGTMLRTVASGPFGEGVTNSMVGGPLLGLLVHFALMGLMVALFQLALRDSRLAALSPWLIGALYGVGLYLVMYGIVLPLRFGTRFPPAKLSQFANALVPHVLLVGIPMALILRRRI